MSNDAPDHAASSQDILALITPSPLRRGIAVFFLAVLAGFLVLLSFRTLGGPVLSLFFLLSMAGLAAWMAARLWQATSVRLELTAEQLQSSTGEVLCRLDEIKSIDRGVFAFKPANGFVLRLKQGGRPRHWSPGLWWRMGRHVGVGGVTSSMEGRHMGELIAKNIADRGA
ncbi:MAG: hypothetical protein AAGF94_16915 [Pseudomonadota bacterium]